MNFPAFYRTYFDEINFLIPEMMEKDYSNQYTLLDNQFTQVNYDLSVYLSCEHFSQDDALGYQYLMEEETPLLDAVHDMYLSKRIESLNAPTVSFKKEIYPKCEFKGYLQTVEGNQSDYYGSENTYCIATLDVDGEYYVFQFIVKAENMPFLEDDFQKMIESVRY